MIGELWSDWISGRKTDSQTSDSYTEESYTDVTKRSHNQILGYPYRMRTQIKVNQEPVKNQQRKNSPKRAFDLYRVEIILYDPLSDDQSIDRR